MTPPAKTLPQYFLDTARRYGSRRVAMRKKDLGIWQEYSWQESLEVRTLMLRLNNVEVLYSGVILVLRGVSLEVGPGEVVALLGANGAGKTTTLKAISGLLRTEEGQVTRGSVEFDGRRTDHLPPEAIVRLGILQVMEGRRLFSHLTVEENLRIGAIARDGGASRDGDLERVYHYFPRLKDLRRRTSGYLSGGERQMLVIGRALMGRPRLLLLDEPSLGLAPLLVDEIFRIIQEINRQDGTAILLVEWCSKARRRNWPPTRTSASFTLA